MWVESQPGPSRSQPCRQGYCGYCRVIYSSLEQHLSSSRHRECVRASSRGSSTVSSVSSSRTSSLMERFLQDVIQHHPHQYNDTRPSHADLPSLSSPLLPREELAELCVSHDDSRSLGTREELPSSDGASCQLAYRQEDDGTHSQSGARVTEEAGRERLSQPIPEQETRQTPSPAHTHTPPHTHQHTPPHTHTPPPVHRKAHRKTNRRRQSDSSCSSPLPPSPPPPPPGPSPSPPGPGQTASPGSAGRRRGGRLRETRLSPPTRQTSWTRVIQTRCYGLISAPCQQGEMESFHFSLPDSLETDSDDWDSPVQVTVIQTEARDLSCLMEVKVDLEDRVYSHQLDSALHGERRGDRREAGYRAMPVEEILPAPPYIPESFRGKTWAQIEREDEEKVENLVRQFRQGSFLCYFDSESLARYGRRRQNEKGRGQNEEAEPEHDALPLLDHDEDDPAYSRSRRRRRRRRAFRLASRCQVVKVSHGTQTVSLVVPAVRRPAPEILAPPPVRRADRETGESPGEEKTPETRAGPNSLRLPPSYSRLVTPLQPRTSLLYLLCSPGNPASELGSPISPAPKRCRKRKRPPERDVQGLKVKYKRLPFMFYDPSSNRILKNAPKGFLLGSASAPKAPPPVVRQLFRSLSPDLNSERLGEGGGGSCGGGRRKVGGGSGAGGATSDSEVKVQGSSSAATPPFSRFPLSALSRDSEQTPKQEAVRRRGRSPQAPPPPRHHRSGRPGRGRGGRRDKTRPPPSKKRGGDSSAPLTPPRPRGGASRRAGHSRKLPASKGPAPPPSHNPPADSKAPPTSSSRRLRRRRRRGRGGCPCCEG
ncbi:DBF4-type zinc finger-containing protein 2 [Centroberyx affinis]|uniref:DBF4-type zinc finger-containing protein 2 n=1 Tax=Centroberyx affinis TaxID=166261 RepID=UPI003A5B9E9E